MATDKLTTTGIVVNREHKDGVTNGKPWDRYGFQIAGKDGKHWYSSLNASSWDALEKGSTWEVWYSEKENDRGGAPHRNIYYWKEVPMDPATTEQVSEVVASHNDRDRRITWNSAVNNAVHLFASGRVFEGSADDWMIIGDWAEVLYELIIDGPSSSEPTQTTQNEPEAPQSGSQGALEPPNAAANSLKIQRVEAVAKESGYSLPEVSEWLAAKFHKDLLACNIEELQAAIDAMRSNPRVTEDIDNLPF